MRKETKTVNRTVRRAFYVAILTLGAVAITVEQAAADEGGVSFGCRASTAALPPPRCNRACRSRACNTTRRYPQVAMLLPQNLDANVDLVLLNPTYVFSTPVFGGQLAIGLMGIVGYNKTSIDGTLTGMVGPIVATRSGSIDSSLSGFGDLYPQASLRWNMGVHNFMTYVTGDIPVGAYNPSRLANLGIGHGAIDGGVGYTYFNPATWHEFSAVTGLTYNFKNNDTNYQNGVDWHLDWGASRFLSKQFFVGAVTFTTKLQPTTVRLRSWAQTNRASSELDRRSVFCFPSGICRAI